MKALATKNRFEADEAGHAAYMLPSVVPFHDGDSTIGERQGGGYFTLRLVAPPHDPAAVEIEGSVALEALLTVKEAAGECAPGEKLKTILPRAAKELGLLHVKGGLRRVRAAWEGTAGTWKAATFLDFLYRRDAMRLRRQRKAREELAALVLTADAIGRRERKPNAASPEVLGVDPDRLRGLLTAAGIVGRSDPTPNA